MPKILAVGGGKGGSGKSFVVANLGVMLAKQGKDVFLIDLDIGTPNLHTMLGIDNPKIGLRDFLNNSIGDLSLAAVQTEVPNLYLISSVRCALEFGNLHDAQKQKICSALRRFSSDYVVIDLGAVTAYNTIDFFLAAHEGLCVLTPEPTSIQNSAQFIHDVYLRKLKELLKRDAFEKLMKEMGEKMNSEAFNSYFDVIRRIVEHNPSSTKMLLRELKTIQFRLVLNQYRKQVDRTLGHKIEKVCNRHFFSHFQFLGNISYNERVFESVVAKKIFALKYPYTSTSTDLRDISKKLWAGDTPSSNPMKAYVEI